jgi:hypothetical protein
MSPEQNYTLMQKLSRILAYVLILLAIVAGLGYLAISTYLYLNQEPLHLWYFVLLGGTFSLTAIFALVMLFRKEKFFIEFAFFFTGLLALAMDLVLLLTCKNLYLARAPLTALKVLLAVNILAILSSFVLPIYRLFNQNGPMWAFMVSYLLEVGIWISAIVFYGIATVSTPDWTFLLLCGVTLLRSAQYEYLGPSEPISR